jgi:hypothetical protein
MRYSKKGLAFSNQSGVFEQLPQRIAMKNKMLFGLLLSCLALSAAPAFSKDNGEHGGKGCKLSGSYGYLYNGTSFSSVAVPLTETGSFSVDSNNHFGGEGTLAFYYSDFHGHGPLWLLMDEVQSNGTVTPNASNPCSGVIDAQSTITVIKSSNPQVVPEGTVLITNAPRSVAYTISGPNVDLISTSPGTIASGTAHKQDN